jgi:hypothetical protein
MQCITTLVHMNIFLENMLLIFFSFKRVIYLVKFDILTAASFKMAVFLVVAPCSLQNFTDVWFQRCFLPPSSGRCLIALMMEAASTSVRPVKLRGLHATTTQKRANFASNTSKCRILSLQRAEHLAHWRKYSALSSLTT